MTNPIDKMNGMNDVTKVTPAQGLAVMSEKYDLDPQVVILFCWQSLVFDYLRRGSLDPEILSNIRSLQSECEALDDEEEDEGNKIIAVSR